MKLLILADRPCDLVSVFQMNGISADILSFSAALDTDITVYDAYCVLPMGKTPDARLRQIFEEAADTGKRVFLEMPGAFGDLYSQGAKEVTRSRLVYLGAESGADIPGLSMGDLLDDQADLMRAPWFALKENCSPVLVYKEHLVAHAHTDLSREELLADSTPGMWLDRGCALVTSFLIHNYNRARYAPRAAWQRLISFVVHFLTGITPARFPDAPVVYGAGDADLSDPAVFEECRKKAVQDGMNWLDRFLVDGGRGGIMEGLRHNISPEGEQTVASDVRTDCTGEAAGAYRMYAALYGDTARAETGEAMRAFVFGPMLEKRPPFRGLLRWTESAWKVNYQDDAARAVLPALYEDVLFGKNDRREEIESVLDFLAATTAKDGCRNARVDCNVGTEKSIFSLCGEEHGCPSAHYNAYYHALLILGYKLCGKQRYLDLARRGLETLMALYPDTRREQSETEEQCRLILPLALLYDTTKEETHREMLYRVTHDLEQRRHPFGGFAEWDTGYRAACSRESTGECSILTENGDPVADFLYSVNWLPVGFAFAYRATGDDYFERLWRETAAFFIKTQMHSENPLWNGAWCRAFDMDREEAFANPHDVGWAACCCESGWTSAEILMGLMLPDFFAIGDRT